MFESLEPVNADDIISKPGIQRQVFAGTGTVGVVVRKTTGPAAGMFAWRLYHCASIVYSGEGVSRVISRKLAAIKRSYVAGGYTLDEKTAWQVMRAHEKEVNVRVFTDLTE